MVSFAAKLLTMVVNPSAAIADPPHSEMPTIIARNLLAAK
jgi:hypothetical protein